MPPPEDPRSDGELIDALNSGDVTAFDALYYRYRDRVARLALRFTGNDADAMDVVQETFAYFYRKFPGFRLTSSLTTFLYPAIRNLSLDLRRRRRRAGSTEEALIELPAPAGSATNERAELATIIASLPPQQREVVLLRFVDDLTIDEIAAAIDVPAGTVKSRLHHAIRALQQDRACGDIFFERFVPAAHYTCDAREGRPHPAGRPGRRPVRPVSHASPRARGS